MNRIVLFSLFPRLVRFFGFNRSFSRFDEKMGGIIGKLSHRWEEVFPFRQPSPFHPWVLNCRHFVQVRDFSSSFSHRFSSFLEEKGSQIRTIEFCAPTRPLSPQEIEECLRPISRLSGRFISFRVYLTGEKVKGEYWYPEYFRENPYPYEIHRLVEEIKTFSSALPSVSFYAVLLHKETIPALAQLVHALYQKSLAYHVHIAVKEPPDFPHNPLYMI